MTFGAVSLGHGGPSRRWTDDEMLHLDRAQPVFRGWAVVFFVGGAALMFLLLLRLFGHWAWGLASGLLWVAQPAQRLEMEIRLDMLLSVIGIATGFAVVRAVERRSPFWYGLAGVLAGAALMTKLPGIALVVPLLLGAMIGRPQRGWARELGRESRAVVRRHPVAIGGALVCWLALALAFNLAQTQPVPRLSSVRDLDLVVAIVAVYLLAAFALARWSPSERSSRRA